MGIWSRRKVLVTGGAGFIGSNLVARLIEEGAQVRVVDSLARVQGAASSFAEHATREIDFQTSDLRDATAARQACRGQECVFHCAARAGSVGYYQAHPGRVLSENLLLDTQLLEAALSEGVSAYFYPSSSMVYPLARQQTPDAPPLKEEDAVPAEPPNSYGWAKLVGERAIEHAATEHAGFHATILRLENPYGPGQDIDLERGSLVPVLVRRALEYPATPFQLRGAGLETRCYCYITDAVDAIVRAVELLDRQCLVGPLNATNEPRLRVLEVVEEVIRQSGKTIKLEFMPGETRIWGQALDCAKARALLAWSPSISLHEGIRRSFEYVEAELDRQGAHVTQ